MENALTNAASQSNFTGLDWGIVVVYLLLSVGVAFFVKRYAGNMTNFVGAGRAVGPWLGIATLTGTEMGLITVMYSAQKGFTGGFAAFHIGIIAGVVAFIIGFTGFIIVRLREHKVLTIPEFYEKRFGRRTRILGGIMLAFGGLLNMGLFLKVGAMFIVGITGMDPDGNSLKMVMVSLLVLVLVYTVIGGMISVVITDYIQFVVLSIGILVTAAYAVSAVGWETIFDTMDTHFEKDSAYNPVSSESSFGLGIRGLDGLPRNRQLRPLAYGRRTRSGDGEYCCGTETIHLVIRLICHPHDHSSPAWHLCLRVFHDHQVTGVEPTIHRRGCRQHLRDADLPRAHSSDRDDRFTDRCNDRCVHVHARRIPALLEYGDHAGHYRAAVQGSPR